MAGSAQRLADGRGATNAAAPPSATVAQAGAGSAWPRRRGAQHVAVELDGDLVARADLAGDQRLASMSTTCFWIARFSGRAP